jgi:hypothetical protein
MSSINLKFISFDFIKQFEQNIINNHQQTIERLAERGGLSPCEALAAILGKNIREIITSPHGLKFKSGKFINKCSCEEELIKLINSSS